MREFKGNRLTIQIPEGNDTGYLDTFNNNTLKVIADFDISSAPLNGETEIREASITGDRFVNNTITNDKIGPQSSLVVLTNDTYQVGRNQADSANLDMIKVNTSDLLEHGVAWEELRLAYKKVLGGETAAAADHDMMKVNVDSHWEWLNTAYSQHIYPKQDGKYDLGSPQKRWNDIHTDNLTFENDGTNLNHYEEGTFSPTIEGGTVAGTATYSTQRGYYWRIGNTIFYEVLLSWSGGTGSGTQMFLKSCTYQANWPSSPVMEPGNHFASSGICSAGKYAYLGPEGRIKEGPGVADIAYSASGTIILQFFVQGLS